MKKAKRIILSMLVLIMLFWAAPQFTTVSAAAKNSVSTSVSSITSKAKGFKVTWKKKSGIKGYQIQYSTSSKFTKVTTKVKTVKGADKTSTTISNLKGCNVTYYIRVRTYKTVSGKYVYSSWSSVKKIVTSNHSYGAATCTRAKTCKYCGKTTGDSLGHKWAKATCTKAKTCTRCEKTTGKALGHKYAAATCTKAKTCTRCAKTSGKALGHNYSSATCTTPKTCLQCGKSKGTTVDHAWEEATCTTPKKCSECGITEGDVTMCQYVDGSCVFCGLDVFIISDTRTISNQTIDTDVYITSTGIATFNNVTVKGDVYCYGQLTVYGGSSNDVYAYRWSVLNTSCGAWDGKHGVIYGSFRYSGSIRIMSDALDYAFQKWGKK